MATTLALCRIYSCSERASAGNNWCAWAWSTVSFMTELFTGMNEIPLIKMKRARWKLQLLIFRFPNSLATMVLHLCALELHHQSWGRCMLLMFLALSSRLASCAFSSKWKAPSISHRNMLWGTRYSVYVKEEIFWLLLRPQVSKLDLDLLKIVAMGDLLKYSWL